MTERLDACFQITQFRLCLGEARNPIQHHQGGVELSTLALLENSTKECPDLGLRVKQLTPLARPVQLAYHSPGQQLSQIHADVATRDPKPLSELFRRPI